MDDPNTSKPLKTGIKQLVQAAHDTGPFFLGPKLSMVDILLAPCFARHYRLISFARNWLDPEIKSRWARWKAAIEADEVVAKTVSGEQAYREDHARSSREA